MADDYDATATPEARAAEARAIRELITSNRVRKALKAGDLAPEFSLIDDTGTRFKLADLCRRGAVVISFYWGSWSKLCALELKALEAALPTMRGYGATLVAIAQHRPPDGRETRRLNGLTLPLLSDAGGLVAEEFGLRWAIPDYLREVFVSRKGHLPDFNGDDNWSLPIPARYIVGPDRIIAYAEVNPNYRLRPEPSDAFATLARLQRI